ncbi:hypothetical protein SteCoe_32812 [Stentor coeruleus]|uniref:PH domain-containing protein n=1 Tax=Stentor coeruleus TaxID=5963 RepID=A0A1R2AYC7_9CILI|nr:hypothetical protein SteCoe_32812 [Stentor coeruleus]
MEQLIKNNPNCADCEDTEICGVNMQLGIFLCEKCSLVHQKLLKMLIRSVQDIFQEEEISFLSQKGNNKINLNLMKNIMPWTVNLKQNDFPQVREWMAEAKYIHQIFAREAFRQQIVHDLTKSWYYLDEVTREITRIRGPYPRHAIKKLIDEEKFLFKDGFVWHPAFGIKWMLVEKVLEIISPKPNMSDQVLQDAFMRKLNWQSYPYPHLRGYLDIIWKNTQVRKWVVILDRQVSLFSSNMQTSNAEISIKIEDVTDLSLVQFETKISIRIDANETFLFYSVKVDEIIEWYHALSSCRYLIHNLGNDYPSLEVDNTELHICNVKNSEDYVGDKIHEGFLKKQGLKYKTSRNRWFILRTDYVFWYANKNDKNYKNFLKITSSTNVDDKDLIDPKDSKPSFHFKISNSKRNLHMWAESQSEKDLWIEKFTNAINGIKERETENTIYTW